MVPFEAKWQAIQHHSEIELQEVERKWMTIKERLQQIDDNKSEWYIHLQRGITELQVHARDTLKYGFMQVRKKLSACLDTPEQLKSPPTIATVIEQDIYELIVTLDRELQQRLEALLSDTESETYFHLNIEFMELVNYSQSSTSLTELPRLTKTELLDSVLLSGHEAVERAKTIGLSGADVGEKVGQIVELASLFTGQRVRVGGAGREVGKAIGGLIGMVGGFAFGFMQEMKQISADDLQKTREDVKEIVGSLIARSEELCRNRLKEILDALELQMREVFSEQIRLEEEICEHTLVTLQGTRNLSQQELLIQKSKLEHIFQEIERLKKHFDELARAVLKDEYLPRGIDEHRTD